MAYNPYDRKLQNSTDYVHPNEANLFDSHKSMEYNSLGQPVSRTSTKYSDSPSNTAFNRLRTANTRLLGEFRNQYGTMGPVEIVTHFENGGTESVDLDETNTTITVTDAVGSRALRQSRKYHPYIPGTTNLAMISFRMQERKSNLHQSVGLFDDLNGIFFRMNNTTPEMVIRKDGVDDQVVPQSEWNVDKLDGTGASKIQLDFTRTQIFICDYQWLGAGRVRVGFNLDGQFFYVHYFRHANQITEPYLFQPSLPARWEIKNVGAANSSSTMMCIAYGVYAEGSDIDTGFENSVSNGTGSVTLGNNPNNIKGILAVRLKNSVNGKPNRALALLKDWQVVTSHTIQYKVLMLQDESDLAGSPVWTDSTPTGWTEYTTDFLLAQTPVPNRAVVLFDGYAVAGGPGSRVGATSFDTDNRSSSIYQNFDSTDSMIIAVVAYRIPNDNAVVRAALNWIEIK